MNLPWNKPTLLMVELTNLCNLRCVMCGIWEERPKHTLNTSTLDAVLAQKALAGVKVVALTGGEPFLIPNFREYYDVTRRRRPRAHINISTNGWYTERTLEFLAAVVEHNLSLTISYDGIRSHDAIRGVDGSAARLLTTARCIKAEFPAVPLSLKLTAMAENHEEITETARQCQELGIPFRFKTLEKLNCHQSRFPSPVQGPNYDDDALRSIAAQARQVLDMGIETNRDYLTDLLRLYDGAAVGCSCSVRTMFLGFDGNVFLCRKKDPIGNVIQEPLDRIWESKQKHEIVHQMKDCSSATDTLSFRHH